MPDHGNDIFLLELVHSKGAGRIAGYHNGLYIFAQQEIYDLLEYRMTVSFDFVP